MSPLISVILPVYNREVFVADAIQSILDQTFADLELIIVDDGSTDSSIEIIKGFTDQRIRILRNEENFGVSAARNKGILEASGKYIAFMDSDDISVPERFAKQFELLEKRPEIDICGSWVQFLNSGKIIRHREKHEEILTQLLLNCSLSLGAVMYKRRSSEELLLDKTIRFGEDYELWSRVCWNWKFYNIQEPLLFYRIHSNQISGVNKNQQLLLDTEIRLSLFKRIGYDHHTFPDEVLKKIILFQEYFDPEEFNMFLNWLKELYKRNFEKKVFPPGQLKNVLQLTKQDLLFKIFFSESDFGINRKWRFEAIQVLDRKDLVKIIKMKIREYRKVYSR